MKLDNIYRTLAGIEPDLDSKKALQIWRYIHDLLEDVETENYKLREALSELVHDIESWEAAVRKVIQIDPAHGMDLSKAKAALEGER